LFTYAVTVDRFRLQWRHPDLSDHTVTQHETVNVSLTSVSGQFVPSTVTLGLALGKPDAESCTPSNRLSTQSGTGPKLTGTYDPGVYCSPARCSHRQHGSIRTR